ncbi:MAG: hypothetical protein CMN30_28565 [Sandaracinus sp.]|nr:hypothetical protein [Sandaracinus sp.]MAR57086.1 hypothetical protein [Rickettsiales bacterium]
MHSGAQLFGSMLIAAATLGVAVGPGAAPCATECSCDDEHDGDSGQKALDEGARAEADAPGAGEARRVDDHAADGHDDECPDDCPRCACGGGGASAPSTSMARLRGPLGVTMASPLRPSGRHAPGVNAGLYRPPRA